MRTLRTDRWIEVGLTGLLTLLLTPAICRSQEAPPSSSESSYGYVSTSEGGVTLVESDTGESVPVEGTEAVLAGDELRLSGGAHAEVQLADRNLLRLAERAELAFMTLAGSPDRSDAVTALRLGRGALQIVVADDYLGETPPAVETSNAYVELRGPGSYVVDSQGAERTLVVVRRGGARVRAGTAITTLRAGEEAVVEGHDGTRVRLAAARGPVAVERWGDALTATYAGATEVYVDESIRYAAAPLRAHGDWVYVRGSRAWRPHVKHDWRPYSRGRWRHTPTGLLWVSYEPWGWVPHHYGNWDLVPGFGWVWFPGRRFASAWVFWYWGPKYVGWVPWGYYSNHYRSRFRLSFAVYGRAGGLAIHFGDWCFTPVNRFGRRHQHRYIRSGRDLGRERERIAQGVITSDTRRLTPGHWTSPDRVNRLLTHDGKGNRAELEDVSPFIYRERAIKIEDDWQPPMNAAESNRTRPSIDPVRTTRTVALAPERRDPATREKARQEVKRRPSIDPVRTTRTVALAPERRDPATREKARQEVRRRPSIDPVRTTRTVAPKSKPETRERVRVEARTPTPRSTAKTPERSKQSRPSVGERTKTPTRATRPESVRRTKPAVSSAPKRTSAAKSAASRASPARNTSRGASRPKPTKSRPN
jgi:hypothetical protein